MSNLKTEELDSMQLVTRKDAAKLLCVSTRTLDRILAESDKFTKYYIRGSVRLSLAELNQFIQSST